MSSNINVLVRTQRIVVDPATQQVAVINAGPQGPAGESDGGAGLVAHAADTTGIHGIADTALLETTTGAQSKVDAHVNDTTDAHDASAISFAPGSGIAATDVQAAILEAKADAVTDAGNTTSASIETHRLDTTDVHGIANTALLETTAGAQTKVDTHVNDTTDAHDASAISFSPAGSIAAINVQAAIEEVMAEAGTGGTANITITEHDAGGGGDLDTAFAAALTAAEAAGGGKIVIAPGTYTASDEHSYDPAQGNLLIYAEGATITYSGTGVFFTVHSSTGGGGTKPFVTVIGGEFLGNATAVGCFRVLDSQGTIFKDNKIRDFSKASVLGEGFAFEIRNEESWCEITRIHGLKTNCHHAIVFTPQSLSGGTAGSASFARTEFIGCQVSGGVAGSGDPLMLLRGGVYDSIFRDIKGNIASGAVAVRVVGGAGFNYGGTLFDGIWGYETTDGLGGGSILFQSETPGTTVMPAFMGRPHVSATNFEQDPTNPITFAARVEMAAIEFYDRGSAPGTPGTDKIRVYNRAGTLYQKDDTGVETAIVGGGGSIAASAVTFDDTVDIAADDVQAAIVEVRADAVAHTGAVLALHEGDTSAHPAANITVADAGGLLAATEVEAALAEIATDIDNHIADTSDAHDASAISFSPASGIAATDAQAAIVEAKTDAEATAAAALASHEADTTSIHGIANTANLETTSGAQTKVDTHVNDTTDAHDASAISFSPASGIAATDVQAAIVEAKSDAEATASTALTAHIDDTSDAHDASAISFSPASGIAATDVQAAIVEAKSDAEATAATALTAHLDDTADAHDASAISFVAGGGIVATNVQTAIEEVRQDGLDNATFVVATHESDTTSVHGIANTADLVTSPDFDIIDKMTQAAYDALGAGRPATTLYVIQG